MGATRVLGQPFRLGFLYGTAIGKVSITLEGFGTAAFVWEGGGDGLGVGFVMFELSRALPVGYEGKR